MWRSGEATGARYLGENNTSKKTLRFLLVATAVMLSWLGIATLITGMLRDEKGFYAIAAVCMSFTSILAVLSSRSNLRRGQ